MHSYPRLAAFALTLAALAVPNAGAQTTAPAAQQPPAGPPANPHPCNDPEYHRFDFWVGDWDVQKTGAPRAPSGASSRIDRILDGCSLLENWTPPNGAGGKSLNIYDRSAKRWEQFWVDATGDITHYVGQFHDDGALYFEAVQFGTGKKIRMTFFPQGPDQVRQLGHISQDDGKTWTVTFDLTYIRKKA